MARTAVIVGATGRLGALVRARLRRSPPPGWRFVLQCRAPPDDPAPNEEWARWRPPEPWPFAGAEAVLCLSGATPTRGRALNEAELTHANRGLALAVADAAEGGGVRRLWVASSAAVYGRPRARGERFREETELAPETAYGRSKAAMERALDDRGSSGMAICRLRISTVAGADQLTRNALEARIEAPLELDRFPSGGGPLRSYIGPEDLARLLVLATIDQRDPPRALNIAAPEPVAMSELLAALGRVWGRPIPWRFRPAPEGAIEDVSLDVSRLASLGYPPADGRPDAIAAQTALARDDLLT